MSKFTRDALERLLATAVVAGISAMLAVPVLDVSAVKAGLFAALTTLLTGVKVLLASQVGDPDSASVLDTGRDDEVSYTY